MLITRCKIELIMMEKNCSFYSLENPCHQEIYVIKQLVQKVESGELDLLVLQARISKRDINTIYQGWADLPHFRAAYDANKI